MAVKARLLATTTDRWTMYLASREAANRRVGTLDKVYTRLMLGKRATLDGDKLKKTR